MVEKEIRKIVESIRSKTIKEVLEYVLLSEGKRIRPFFVFFSSEKIFGFRIDEKISKAALCVELLHNASLMIDDVIDNSHQRRGKTSANYFFGNKITVISASYLIAYISQELSEIGVIELIKEFSSVSKAMAEGEILEMSIKEKIKNGEDEEKILQTYLEMINLKTAKLFSLCFSIPAILNNLSQNEIQFSKRLGKLVGMAFQIKDDILDFTSHSIGKPILKDVSEKNITLPIILSNNFEEIIKIYEKDSLDEEDKYKILELVILGDGIKRAEERAKNYIEEAKKLLCEKFDGKRLDEIFEPILTVINREK